MVAPPHVARDRLALRLRERCEHCRHHFAGHFRGVDVFLLKVYADAEQFQLPNQFQAFFGVACEAGDGFYQDAVDLSFSAVRQEPLKVLAFLCGSTRNAPICINIDYLPILFAGNQVGIVLALRIEGVDLVIRCGADTSVSGYAQLDFLRLFLSVDYDDSLLATA